MFHRVIGLSSVLLVCLAGCSLCSHHGSGCGKHRHQHGNLNSFNAVCGEGLDCACAAPLYPGDPNYNGNCKKHGQQRRMRRMATAFRRSTSKWMSGSHASGCACDSCGYESYFSQPMMWEESACGEPLCGVPQVYGCDSCAPSMTGDWSVGGFPAGGEFYGAAYPASTGCDCGQQHSADGSMYIPEGFGPYDYSTEAPMMNVPANAQGNTAPRSFPPSNPVEAEQSPAPIPQDLTPMNTPMEFPKNAPGEFDPLQQEGAPAADKVLDPVSFEIPRLPPLPERAHSSVKRGGSHHAELISTESVQFQR